MSERDPNYASLTAGSNDLHRQRNEGISCDVLWLTNRDVMAKAGISRQVLRREVKDKKITPHRRGIGRLVTLYHPDEVARYLAERNKENT